MRLRCVAVKTQIEFVAERIQTLPDRSRLYPWGEWADGSAWRIRRGEDYAVTSVSMAQIVREYGRRNRLAVTATVNSDVDAVEFQFSREEAAA